MKEDKEIEKEARSLALVLVSPLILIAIISVVAGSISIYNLTTNLNNKCINLGYNKLTDYKHNNLIYNIECDNKILNLSCGFINECLKVDKWSNCENTKRVLVCE